jgi:hypothetical protein
MVEYQQQRHGGTMSPKYTKILFVVVFLFALASPSRAQTAPSEDHTSSFVTTSLTPPSVMVGESSTVTVNLNNIPAEGIASAEFTCTYNPAMVEVSTISPTNLFGGDPILVVNGPQNGGFIFAIAGSIGNKATTGGAAFTFSAKGLQLGQSAIDCQGRVSTGNLVLETIPSTPASLDVIDIITTPAQGTFAGQVLAGKPVTVTLTDPNGSVAGSVTANADGTFSLSVPANTYTAVASAPGHLRAQGSVSITNGNTTTLVTINLPAGDIDGNDVIDQFDALTIGINYNGTAPAAADLSNDGTINVLELEILAPNYRQSGPLAVSTGDSPVATSTPVSNSTQISPAATNSPMPNPMGTPTMPMPTQQGHDSTRWHSLGFGHEHGDDPNSAAIVAVFGRAGDLWNSGTGQNIGVPFATSPIENTMKHPMAKYYTMTRDQIAAAWDASDPINFSETTDNSLSGNNHVRAWRILAHGGGNLMEALSNNHSVFAEIQICDVDQPDQCGVFRSGGWIFWGRLQSPFYNQVFERSGGTFNIGGMTMTYKSDQEDLASIGSTKTVFDEWGGEPYWFMFPFTGQSDLEWYRNNPFDLARQSTLAGDQFSSNEVSPYNYDCAPFASGCGNNLFHLAIRVFDGWNLLDRSNIYNPVFICSQLAPSNCNYNGTYRGMKEVAVYVPVEWDQSSFDTDQRMGFVTLTRYTDRYQRLRPEGECTSISVDCVPLVLTNVPIGYASIKLKIQEPVPGIDREYDCPQGGCISFPN